MTSTPSNLSLKVSRRFTASRERVFEAWKDPDLLKRWLGGSTVESPYAEVDFRVGGHYRVRVQPPGSPSIYVTGVFQEIVSPSRLVYTWAFEDNISASSLVTVELHEVNGGTEVMLIHEQLPDERTRTNHEIGWVSCLENLHSLVQYNS